MSYSAFAAVYDELMKPAGYKERADYIIKILSSYGITDGLLLDLACGTGELSCELSRRGFEVIGTDASADMLCEAQTKAYDAGQNILFLCQRMEETDLYGTVRAIICTLDSINHLESVDALFKTFSRLKNFIDPGGIMIFDVNTVFKHREILGNNIFVYDEKGVYCVWRNSLHPDGRTVSFNLDFFVREGSKYSRYGESFKEIAFTDGELTAACEQNGFEVLDRFGENGFEKINETTQRAVYVIRRK